jgi:hypothetical protein
VLRLLGSSAFDFQFVGSSRLSCRKARREDAEGRAGHVIQPNLMAEFDRRWLPAMFTADADF